MRFNGNVQSKNIIYNFFLVTDLSKADRSYKSILVTRNVYEKLRELKRAGESFSGLINRLIEQSVTDSGLEKLVGVLAENDEAAKIFEEALKEASKYFRWVDLHLYV